MATFINNFKIQERICNNCYPSTCQLIVIKDSIMSLACHQCYTNNRLRNQQAQFYSFDSLKEMIQGLVKKQKEDMKKIPNVQIKKIISEKKSQYQIKQYRLIQQIMKKLNDVKEAFFLHLDMCQANYSKKLEVIQAQLKKRKQTVNYLDDFSEDIQLLRLKLIISNQEGLKQFYSYINNLQKSKQQRTNENHLTSINNIIQQLDKKLKENLSLFSKIQIEINSILQLNCTKKIELPINPQIRLKNNYNNQSTQRTNQSRQNISVTHSPRSRMNSQCQNFNFAVR